MRSGRTGRDFLTSVRTAFDATDWGTSTSKIAISSATLLPPTIEREVRVSIFVVRPLWRFSNFLNEKNGYVREKVASLAVLRSPHWTVGQVRRTMERKISGWRIWQCGSWSLRWVYKMFTSLRV